MKRRHRRIRDDRFNRRRKKRTPRLVVKILLASLIGFTAWQWGHVGIIQAKAWLAPILIERAWADSRAHGVDIKPWPWADTWPVAEMSVPSLGIRQIILSGDSGRVLAFGPGHTEQSAQPGAAGLAMVSAHRDTYFQFLQELKAGDDIFLNTVDATRRYEVKEFAVVDQRHYQVDSNNFYDPLPTRSASLILVPCYSFDAIRAGGDQRFLVFAVSSLEEII